MLSYSAEQQNTSSTDSQQQDSDKQFIEEISNYVRKCNRNESPVVIAKEKMEILKKLGVNLEELYDYMPEDSEDKF